MSLLSVKNINKRFGGIIAVDDFSMEVNRNEVVGIIGPNGAGKTTIYNLISKVIDIDSGQVFLEDQEITKIKQEKVAIMGVARTFQNIRLFQSLTVLDNVKVPCDYKPRYTFLEAILLLPRRWKGEKQTKKEAMDCLELVGLSHLSNEKPANLPYGMQRRLEIARALALNPKILFLDEPAAGLNPEEALGLVDFLKSIMKKLDISMVVIEHRMDVIMELCDNIYVQDFGKTIAVGTPREIQTNPHVLSAYLGEEDSHA